MRSTWVMLGLVLISCSDGPTGPRPARLELAVSSPSLAVGDTTIVMARVLDASGDELIPNDGSSVIDHVTFSVAPAGIITIARDVVTAIGQGTAQLTGTVEGIRTTLTFTVRGIAHRRQITTSETWRAADGPHFVRDVVPVSDGATLTIEPGTEVRFNRRAGLSFATPNAALRAMGTAAAPIRMTADTIEPPPTTPDSILAWFFKGFWTGIRLGSTASEVRHVEMRYCGGDGLIAGCVMIAGNGNEPRPTVQNLTAFRPWLGAVNLTSGGGFGPGSGDITVTEAGSRFCYCVGGGSPIVTSANSAGTIPQSSTFRDNYTNMIIVLTRPGESGRVTRSQRWPNIGLPYLIYDSIHVGGVETPVLSLAAGVRLEFNDTFGTFTVGARGPGDLVTEGTAASPVVLTRHGGFGGHWNGIVFGPDASTASRLRYTVIDSAGGYNAVYQWGAAAVVQRNGLDSLFQNTTFRSMSHATTPCDIRRAWTPNAVNTDYTSPSLGNVFTPNPRVAPQCGPP